VDQYIQVEKHGEWLVGRFLVTRVIEPGELGDELHAIATHSDCVKLILNLSGVKFISAAMLSKLFQIRKVLEEKGGVFRLCELSPDVRKVFQACRFDRFIDVCDTQTAALEM